MADEAKAAREIAKATRSGIEAAREFGGFISKFISGPLEQGMGIFEDKLKYMRWERQVAFKNKANKKLAERGLDGPTQTVPLKITIPLLHAASMEENDDLQSLWANLLVNAADKDSGVEIRHTYLTILQDLTAFDVQILHRAYSAAIVNADPLMIPVNALTRDDISDVSTNELFSQEPDDRTSVAIENLCRLNLLKAAQFHGANTISGVTKTRLGHFFILPAIRQQVNQTL